MRIFITFLLIWGMAYGHGFKVLVYSKTAGFRHVDGIREGTKMLQELGVEHEFSTVFVDAQKTDGNDAQTQVDFDTADNQFFNELPSTDVVVFLNPTGDVFDPTEQATFQSWYRSGNKGYVGIHSAADTEKSWPWYTELVGAQFLNHGATQTARMEIMDQTHPITNIIDPSTGSRLTEWTKREEWYNFKTENADGSAFYPQPRGNVHVLALVDENTMTANKGANPMGDDHPIVWNQVFDGGRSVYISPGHVGATYSDSVYRDLVTNSIEWAAGELGGDSGATIEENFEKITLSTDFEGQPMAMAIDQANNVYVIERQGAVKVYEDATGIMRTIGTLDEYSGGEYGLLGIALAPDFETTKQLYIHWSPKPNEYANTRISRFTLNSERNLDLSSEAIIIEYHTDRNSVTGVAGHHQSGDIHFDPDGNLLFSVGDNTQASGYSPRSPREIRVNNVNTLTDNIGLDARKASPNTNDLRGKINRITPIAGGGPSAHPYYTIPDGNMFAVGTPKTRGEIYAMGFRNCFRFLIDQNTGWLYVGDVGPDAGTPDNGAFQGPSGHDEFNQVKSPGWFGWPYYIGDNLPYLDGDTAAWSINSLRTDLNNFFNGSLFSNSAASAGNPNLLSDPQPAWIYYTKGASELFPEIDPTPGNAGWGRSAMAGAAYTYQAGNNLPQYYDKSIFLMEWIRDEILEVKTREDGSILEITEFAPHIKLTRPIDMAFSPDGTMYVLEFGASFGALDPNPKGLVKIQYNQGASTPIASIEASQTSGSLPLLVNFDASTSSDPDGARLTYQWDFDGDGTVDSTNPIVNHTYRNFGTYNATLTVTNSSGLLNRSIVRIYAGNSAPIVTFNQPLNNSFFDWGDTVAFNFDVIDAEDGSTITGQITKEMVTVEASLGHDDHQHNDFIINDYSGKISIPRDDSHAFDADLAYVFDASYTDRSINASNSITGTAKAVIQPKVKMAHAYSGQSGVTISDTRDPVGGDLDITGINHRDYIYFNDINLSTIEEIRVRAAGRIGGFVRVRYDSPTGPLLAAIPIAAGDGETYRDYTRSLSSVVNEPRDLYFVFNRPDDQDDIFRVNWINFRGKGASIIHGQPVVKNTSVETSSGTTIYKIRFDQAMDYATLGNLSNYSIDGGVNLISATPWENQEGVDLTVSNVIDSQYYTLTLNNIEDLAGDTIEPNTTIVLLNLNAATREFSFGLNVSGNEFTSPDGNYYTAGNAIYEPTNKSLVVDFRAANGRAITSVIGDFQFGDSSLTNDTIINVISDSSASGVSLDAIGMEEVSLSLSNTSGIFNTNKGTWDDEKILDGYLFSFVDFNLAESPRALIEGLDEISPAETIKLVVWGVGDTPDSESRFQITHGGVSYPARNTNYDAAKDKTIMEFEFPKSDSDNSIDIKWGKATSEASGFNGFSLTTSSDHSFLQGSPNSGGTTNPIANSDGLETIYQSHNWFDGDLNYEIPLENGQYDVILRFSELFFTEENRRTFNANVESVTSIFPDNLDIFSEVGIYEAFHQLVEDVSVTDGILNIDILKTGLNNPLLSGIEIHRQIDPLFPEPSFIDYLHKNKESQFSPNLDIDSDSLSTLMEYALGTDDQNTNYSSLPIFGGDQPDNYTYRFKRPVGLPDLEYVIEASETLQTTNWRTITPNITLNPDGAGMEEVMFERLDRAASQAGFTDGRKCFFRMKVNLKQITD